MSRIFEDRRQAGRLLADLVSHHIEKVRKSDVVILALPRGGVPVAFEVAQALDLPLDILVVRKIGHPNQPEYGIGAIAEGGYHWIDPDAAASEIPASQLRSLIARERLEVDRRVRKYRGKRRLPMLKNKTVVLIDDGLATGVTARVATQYLESQGATRVILAAPVCSERTAKALRSKMDGIACLSESSAFFAVGEFFQDFKQVSDDEVVALLALAKHRPAQSRRRAGPYAAGGVRSREPFFRGSTEKP